MADETNNALTPEQMAARIAQLEARIAKGGALRFKVSEKGAISVYGLGRFPVTLYVEQWGNLLSHTDELRHFIESNRAHLKLKDKKPNPQRIYEAKGQWRLFQVVLEIWTAFLPLDAASRWDRRRLVDRAPTIRQ